MISDCGDGTAESETKRIDILQIPIVGDCGRRVASDTRSRNWSSEKNRREAGATTAGFSS
ncbi:hypothetical protein [Haloarcula amylovorans]|uniref:hypothetical protein n=1 Tax=Haloarcula amylovorans TaxID=2562280 RepID=UPI001075F356|nr:hypothetical protein [Halomicroarcula amylolytica]